MDNKTKIVVGIFLSLIGILVFSQIGVFKLLTIPTEQCSSYWDIYSYNASKAEFLIRWSLSSSSGDGNVCPNITQLSSNDCVALFGDSSEWVENCILNNGDYLSGRTSYIGGSCIYPCTDENSTTCINGLETQQYFGNFDGYSFPYEGRMNETLPNWTCDISIRVSWPAPIVTNVTEDTNLTCIPILETCSDGSTIISQECINNSLVNTTNVCPAPLASSGSPSPATPPPVAQDCSITGCSTEGYECIDGVCQLKEKIPIWFALLGLVFLITLIAMIAIIIKRVRRRRHGK